MPYKRDDIMKRVAKVDGVREVRDNIQVLPVSQFDDGLRYRIARAIYSNPNFWNYAIRPNPSDPHRRRARARHADRRRENNVDRDAGAVAGDQFGVLSVTNDLKTDAEMREALEKSE